MNQELKQVLERCKASVSRGYEIAVIYYGAKNNSKFCRFYM